MSLIDRRPPTQKQLEIHAYMTAYSAFNGAPPSTREIAEHFGWASLNAVADHMHLMKRKGMVKHYPGRARGWVPLPIEVRP